MKKHKQPNWELNFEKVQWKSWLKTPVLWSIVKRWLEQIVVSKLVNSVLNKFYVGYVDENLFFSKEDNIDNIVQCLTLVIVQQADLCTPPQLQYMVWS